AGLALALDAVERYRDIEDMSALRHGLQNLSECARAAGQPNVAIEASLESLAISEQLGSPVGEHYAQLELAQALESRDEAIVHARRALEIANGLDKPAIQRAEAVLDHLLHTH